MNFSPQSFTEEDRLKALHELGLLDTATDPDFQNLAELIANICDVPIAAISLIDRDRQWFMAIVGLDVKETSRDVSFCAHAIKQSEPLLIKDARQDIRFSDNSLVTGHPNVVFYGGASIHSPSGEPLGALCVIDQKPRELTREQLEALQKMAAQVDRLIQLKTDLRNQKSVRQYVLESLNSASPFYLFLEKDFTVTEAGISILKSVPELKTGTSFLDYFKWSGFSNPESIFIPGFSKSRLLFFETLDGTRKFKCCVRGLNDRAVFLLINPVINNLNPLKSYHLDLKDFSPHDYVSEFLFLQSAATKGLEETQRMNEIISRKNKELEKTGQELKELNQALEKRVEERTRRIRNLSLFPEHNPNPVVEYDLHKGGINYCNPAFKKHFAEILQTPFHQALDFFGVAFADVTGAEGHTFEFKYQKRYYEARVYHLSHENFIRVYFHDFTQRREMEIRENLGHLAFIRQQKSLLRLRSLSQGMSFQNKLKEVLAEHAKISGCEINGVWLMEGYPDRVLKAPFLFASHTNDFLEAPAIAINSIPDYFQEIVQNEKLVFPDARTHWSHSNQLGAYLQRNKSLSFLALPVKVSNQVVGVFTSEYFSFEYEFVDEDISFCRSISDVVALIYESEQLRRSNEDLSMKSVALEDAMQRLVSVQDDMIKQEKLATMGMLIAGIAHEVNTPLGAIKASNQIVRDTMAVELINSLLQYSADELNRSARLFSLFREAGRTYTTREERGIFQHLMSQINSSVPECSSPMLFARKVFELGHVELTEEITVFLRMNDAARIFEMASSLSRVMKSVKTIEIAVDKAARVVKSLNNFSHGNPNDEKTHFNLYDSFESVIMLLWNKIKTGAVVSNLVPPDILVYGNMDELAQVWTNIVNNALQASNNNCNVWLKYRKDQDHHEIELANDGPPIPESILPRIFDPFYTTKKTGEGSGLGLNISKKIIEKHSGSIVCTSSSKETSFLIRIPLSLQK